MYRVFPCIGEVYPKPCCTWAISVRPLAARLVTASAKEGGARKGGAGERGTGERGTGEGGPPISVGPEWRRSVTTGIVTTGIVDCREEPARLEGDRGPAAKYAGRGASSGVCRRSGPTSSCFGRCRFNHHLKVRKAIMPPIATAPNTPAIMAGLGDGLLSLAFAAEVLVTV